jgi:WD40 repeat protein/tRNA A-37 threonylcarbamoyl transferase component Bud32
MGRTDRLLSLDERLRLDQVCLAFEAAWKSAAEPRVEQYLADVAEPERSALLRELLLLDVDYRHRRGEGPTPEEYRDRFPQDAAIIEEIFETSSRGTVPFSLRENRESPQRPQVDTDDPPKDVKRVRYFGDYELLEEIARGGMGVVYKARQVSLNRPVALKMILAGQLASPEEVERFHKEAEVAANLQHPNIVEIHEVGEHEGQHYFSMDYIQGRSLAAMVHESPLSAQRAAEYMKTVALAVDYAHQQGTLHRDLKPANVLIDRADQPRITDFGLARRTEAISDLTVSGQVVGTPSYLSPEQAKGDLAAIGPANDVYGLGATLYELLIGRPPFRGETAVATLRQVVDEEPVSPRRLNASVPRDLDVICLRCLEKAPYRRYASAHELADDLDRFLQGVPIRARPIGCLERAWRWCKRRPMVAALASATLVLLVVVAVGASVAALLLARERNATRRAEAEVVEKLWESYLDQARARRWSGLAGRRVESLEALASAAAIRPSLELRNEAIACMALVDLRVARECEGLPPNPSGLSFSIAFDAKLERYTVGDARGNLSIRNVSDSREVMRLPGPGSPAWIVRFSPGGRWLAAKYCPPDQNDTNRVWVWDLARGQVLLKTDFPIFSWAMAFSPDERWLAAGRLEGGISLFDLTTGAEARRLPSESSVANIAFHPDGSKFAARTLDNRVFVRSTDGGETLRVLPGGRGPAWNPTGRLLAVCSDSRIHVYDADTWQERAVLEGQAGPVEWAFSHGNDLLASAGDDLTLRLWHPLDSNPLLTVPGAVVGGPAFAPNDRLLASRIDGSRISLFEVIGAPECRRLIVEAPSSERIWDTDVSPDGRLLAAACNGSLRLWDLARGDQLVRLPGSDFRAAKFTRDGTALIVAGEDGLSWWQFTGDEQAGAGALRMGPREPILLPTGTAAPGCSVGSDGCTLAVALADSALVFDLKTQKEKARFGGQRGSSGATLSPGGEWLVSTTWHGSGAKVFDTRNGKLVLSVPETANSVAAFSPDGKWLVIGTGPEYRLWSVGSWEPGLRIARAGTADLPGPAAFTPDGRVLALVPSRPLVRLIDVQSSLELATLEAPNVQERVTTLSFSPDAARLIAGSLARRLHVWDLRLIRQRLAAMDLDWDLPPYAPADEPATSPPLRVDVVK